MLKKRQAESKAATNTEGHKSVMVNTTTFAKCWWNKYFANTRTYLQVTTVKPNCASFSNWKHCKRTSVIHSRAARLWITPTLSHHSQKELNYTPWMKNWKLRERGKAPHVPAAMYPFQVNYFLSYWIRKRAPRYASPLRFHPYWSAKEVLDVHHAKNSGNLWNNELCHTNGKLNTAKAPKWYCK